MTVDPTTIITTLFGASSLGYMIVKHFLDSKKKKEEVGMTQIEEFKEEIRKLNDKLEALNEERMQLMVKASRLEERIMLHAKNKVKHKIDLDEID